jgi:hypothetical protein
MGDPIDSYAAFWAHYLRAHRHPANRVLHYAATGSGLLLLAAAIWRTDWRLAVAAPLVGYAVAWVGHGAVEGNRPASFGHPLWSLASDFRMLGLFATGRLSVHLARHIGREIDTTPT